MVDYHLKRMKELHGEAMAALAEVNTVADKLKSVAGQWEAEIKGLESRMKSGAGERPTRLGPTQERLYGALLELEGSPGGKWITGAAILTRANTSAPDEEPITEAELKRSLKAAAKRKHVDIDDQGRYRLFQLGLDALG